MTDRKREPLPQGYQYGDAKKVAGPEYFVDGVGPMTAAEAQHVLNGLGPDAVVIVVPEHWNTIESTMH